MKHYMLYLQEVALCGGEEDPEQPEIGSWQKSRTENKHKNKSQRLKLNLALFAKTHSTKC